MGSRGGGDTCGLPSYIMCVGGWGVRGGGPNGVGAVWFGLMWCGVAWCVVWCGGAVQCAASSHLCQQGEIVAYRVQGSAVLVPQVST